MQKTKVYQELEDYGRITGTMINLQLHSESSHINVTVEVR